MSILKLICLFLSLTVLTGSVFAKGSDLSDTKFDSIKQIVESYKSAGEDLNDPDVKAAIFQDVSKISPLAPKEPANNKSTSELYQDAKLVIEKKFPKDAKKLVKSAHREANQKFKLARPLSYVTVLYERGDKIYKVSGVFYSYGGNSIKIDEKNVAIFDLLPDYRVKFDKGYCEKRKKEFIKEKLQEYFQAKNKYSTKMLKKMKTKQQKYNEKLGYIYAWKEWRTAKYIAEAFIKSMSTGKILTAKSDIDKGSAKDKKDKTSPNKPKQPEKVEEEVVEESPKPKVETEYEKLVKQSDAILQKIGKTYAGIDADQGYKRAIWGMSRKDVSILLKGAIPAESPQGVSTIDYPSGPISSVQLHFYHGFFYKVVINFRIGPVQAMKTLALRLNERYGRSNEEKEALKKQAQADNAEKAAKDKTGKKGKGKKGKKKPAPKKPDSLEQIFHWTGDITNGTLYIKINADKTGYEVFTFTKENPKVKDDVAVLLKRQEQKKKAKEREKELQQFKNIKKIEF